MGTTFRFVHTADLHLDAPFRGVDAAHPDVRDALLGSTYDALDRVVAACLEHEVDFLVVAGDLYNARDKSLRAQMAFQRTTERLEAAGVSVYVARGNHDPADGWSARLELPDTVHVFAHDAVERVEHARDGEVLCALYGRSFPVAVERDNLARGFVRGREDPFAIGVLHANVGGREGHEAYAPCDADDLRTARMDYWALGHIHRAETVLEDPLAVYPGSTQGLNPRETGAHGCALVEVREGVPSVTPMPTCSVVWSGRQVDASALSSIEELRAAIGGACESVREDADGLPAIVRLDVVGRTPVHGALTHGDVMGDLLADARAAEMDRRPWVWIDRLRDLTAPEIDLDAVRSGQDLAADLVQIVDELLLDPAGADQLLDEVLDPLESKIGDLSLDAPSVLERARDALLERLGIEAER
jgi:DNA repair exonuclease SbcCD nuclease subunit